MFPNATVAISATLFVAASFFILWFLPKPNVRGDLVVLISSALALTLVLMFGTGFEALGLREPPSAIMLLLESLGLVAAAIAAKVLVVDLLAIRVLRIAPQKWTVEEKIYRQPRLFAKKLWLSWYAGLSEELLFRGFLQTSFMQIASTFASTSPATLIAVSLPALLFGVAHKSQGAAGIITATTIGLCFGTWFAYNGGELLPLIVAHCAINSITYVAMFLVPPERIKSDA